MVDHSMTMPRDPCPRADSSSDFTSRARDMLRRAVLRDLTGEERLLLVLRYAEGLSLPETAETLQMTTDEVRRMHEQIVSRLGDQLRAA